MRSRFKNYHTPDDGRPPRVETVNPFSSPEQVADLAARFPEGIYFTTVDLPEFEEAPYADDPVCMCGTEESAHNSVDPPHAFVDAAHYYDEERS